MAKCDARPLFVRIGICRVYAALFTNSRRWVVANRRPADAVLHAPAVRGVETTNLMTTNTMTSNTFTNLTNMTSMNPSMTSMTTPTTWNDGEWRDQAACANFDTNLFFPEPDASDALAQISQAKAVCAACPVRDNCLEFAIRTRQLDGVWGGCTPEERRSIRRRRQAAARKAAA